MTLLSATIMRGTRATQPLATLTATGALYFVTDEGVTERCSGTAWESYSAAAGAASPLVRLATNSGSDATAAPTNVFTLPITGLTALDRLKILLSMSSTGNSTGQPLLYQVTDAVSIIPVYLGQGAVGSGRFSMEEIIIGPQPNLLTGIVAWTQGWSSNLTFMQGWGQGSTWVQNWTGAWTLALRTGAGGVVAGGTFRWNIAVYKMLGQ